MLIGMETGDQIVQPKNLTVDKIEKVIHLTVLDNFYIILVSNDNRKSTSRAVTSVLAPVCVNNNVIT